MKLETYLAAVRAERDNPTAATRQAVYEAFAAMCDPNEGISPWWFIGASIECTGDDFDLGALTEEQAKAFVAGMDEMGEGPLSFDWVEFFKHSPKWAGDRVR